MNNTKNKPVPNDVVKINHDIEGAEDFNYGRVLEVFEDISSWWDTTMGENKVALKDALDNYGIEKAATAEWFAIVENVGVPGETMAVASFECELM